MYSHHGSSILKVSEWLFRIIGLYVSFIFVIGSFVRMQTTGLVQGILFKHLPFVDRIHRVCLDIYLVRQFYEFKLEEELYSKLIFLYRSPETLVKWTRPPPKEKED
jgi:hypothetical protein